jgi:hypothetical protein
MTSRKTKTGDDLSIDTPAVTALVEGNKDAITRALILLIVVEKRDPDDLVVVLRPKDEENDEGFEVLPRTCLLRDQPELAGQALQGASAHPGEVPVAVVNVPNDVGTFRTTIFWVGPFRGAR